MRRKIFLSVVTSLVAISCSTKQKKIESPLFEAETPLETDEQLAALPKEDPSLLMRKISDVPTAPPKPRTVLTANRKAPETPLSQPQPDAEMNADFVVYKVEGQEKLSLIARGLLGDVGKIPLLEKWNPGLDSKSLVKGQEIRVMVKYLKPNPIYLTRDFAIQNKVVLQKVLVKNQPSKEYLVQEGDTLQKISQKLYSTTRRWTELYLINQDLIPDPDRVPKELKLRHN